MIRSKHSKSLVLSSKDRKLAIMKPQLTSLIDVMTILGRLFSSEGAALSCLDAADANDDGKVDLSDALMVLLHLFKMKGPLPPPFEDCGIDPSSDALGCAAFEPCRQE